MAALPYRPAIVDFAFDLPGTLGRRDPLDATTPIPTIRTSVVDHKQILLEQSPPPPCFMRRIPHIFRIRRSDRRIYVDWQIFTFLVTVVLILSFRCGVSPGGADGGFVFARINAQIAQAVVSKNYEASCVGIPARGSLPLPILGMPPPRGTSGALPLSAIGIKGPHPPPRRFCAEWMFLDHEAIQPSFIGKAPHRYARLTLLGNPYAPRPP